MPGTRPGMTLLGTAQMTQVVMPPSICIVCPV
jgi:hypothetical protein